MVALTLVRQPCDPFLLPFSVKNSDAWYFIVYHFQKFNFATAIKNVIYKLQRIAQSLMRGGGSLALNLKTRLGQFSPESINKDGAV